MQLADAPAHAAIFHRDAAREVMQLQFEQGVVGGVAGAQLHRHAARGFAAAPGCSDRRASDRAPAVPRPEMQVARSQRSRSTMWPPLFRTPLL